jgi:hypothetical protein
MGAGRYVYLEDVAVKRLTDKAALVVWEGEEYWLPLSQLEDPDKLQIGEDGYTLGLTEWICEQKGIDIES